MASTPPAEGGHQAWGMGCGLATRSPAPATRGNWRWLLMAAAWGRGLPVGPWVRGEAGCPELPSGTRATLGCRRSGGLVWISEMLTNLWIILT